MKNIKNVQIRELLENDANVDKYMNFGAFSNKEQMFEYIAKEEDNILKEVKRMSLRVVDDYRYDHFEKYTNDDLINWFCEKWDHSYKRLELLILDYFLLRHRKVYCYE